MMTDPAIPPPAIETLIQELRRDAKMYRTLNEASCDAAMYERAADALTASATSLREMEQQERKTPNCGGCGGPHPFDTSVPSVQWNQVVRPLNGSEYLCTTCVLRAFARAGVSFIAELNGDGFSRLPIEIRINGQDANAVAKIQDENNSLRYQLAESATRLQQLGQERKQQPTPVLDSLHAVMTNHGIASRASEYESLITELVQWAAKACRQSQDTRFRQSQLEYDEAVHVNRMLIDGVTDATVDAFLEKQQTYQQRAEHAEAHLQQLQEAQTQIRELASQALDASPDTMDDSKAHE